MLKILFCQHNSICEPGILRALQNLGHQTVSFKDMYSDPEEDAAYEGLIQGECTDKGVNIVFSVNFIPVISRACEKARVPYVCWIVDSPVIQLYSGTVRNACNYIFIFDSALYAEFADCNPGHLFYWPLGCDLELYDTIVPDEEDHVRYDCDISFVASLYSEKCSYNAIKSRLPEFIQGYFDGILNAQRMVYGYNFLQELLSDDIVSVLRQCVTVNWPEGYQMDERVLFGNIFLNPKCTEMERIHLLNKIAERFAVDLYTESDTSPLRGVRCHGVVSSMGGMPRVFKCSRINLNLTAKGIQAGGSLRVYDILGCGGFLLSNYQADLAQQFVDGKELVMFESEQDLLDKIQYYLCHEEERMEIAGNGYRKVKEEYTYRVRLEKMLDIVCGRSGGGNYKNES